MNDNVLLALGLTLFAGLSTGIGSLIAFFAKHTNRRFLSAALGLSAGVMIYVSFMEMLPEAVESLQGVFGESKGAWAAVGAFFGGIILAAVIDRLIPEHKNPHARRTVDEMESPGEQQRLMRMGLMTALAIAIHNFPEGIATFAAAMKDPKLGVSIAIAIAIHNIPEGIAVSVPIYCATGKRRKAFLWSFLSGLSEPLGALVAWGLLSAVLSDELFGMVFAAAAGIMVFISMDELFPAARDYGEGHLAIYGLITGMGIMAVSLLLFI